MGFKPCYKWNAFNTEKFRCCGRNRPRVLNLVISGMPSIQNEIPVVEKMTPMVLNLVISGMPSILSKLILMSLKN